MSDERDKHETIIETAMRERSAVEAPPPGSALPGTVHSEDAWAGLEDDWQGVMPYLREDFPALESEELEATGGNYGRLLTFLEERYRLTRREAEERLGAWLERFRGR